MRAREPADDLPDARTLTHRTVQKVVGRATRRGWIDVNAAENAEKATVKRSDEFDG